MCYSWLQDKKNGVTVNRDICSIGGHLNCTDHPMTMQLQRSAKNETILDVRGRRLPTIDTKLHMFIRFE